MFTRALIVACLVALAVARPQAQTAEPVSSLVDSSTVIATGQVVALSSAYDGVAIYTYVTLQVAEVLKGSVAAGDSIVVKQMGGVANGIGLRIDGQARFAVGDDVLVFLGVRPRDHTLYTVGLAQGAWRAADVAEVRAEVMAQPQPDPRAAEPFVTRPPEMMAAADLTTGSASFTFLEGGPARWHEADEGVPIPVDFVTPPVDGMEALDAAIGAWNAVRTTLQLNRGNSGSERCPGFSGNGPRIAFYWDDCGEIGDSLTFGVGGGYFTNGSLRTVNGVVFAKFLEGIAILKDGGPTPLACLKDAATHVLGHAVGLGHSSDGNAVMFSTLRAACNSGGLGNDDIAGLRAIYPAMPGGGERPDAPTAFAATVTGSTVALSWTPATTGGVVLDYVIEAGSSTRLANLAALTVSGSQSSLTVTGVPSGAYFVRVKARNALGEAVSSERLVIVGPCALPGTPAGLSYTAVDNIVSFSWTPPASSPPLQGYVLSAGYSSGQANAAVVKLDPTPAAFSAFAPAGNYFVRVQAENACGLGPPTADLLVAVQSCGAPPSAPSNLRFTRAGNDVTLNWNAPASGSPSRYRLVVGSVAGASDILISDTSNNSTSLVARAPMGTYFVKVQAVNLCGASLSSNEVIVTVP